MRHTGAERKSMMLYYIVDYKERHDGLSPSVREIAVAIGYEESSTTRVHDYLREMEEAGDIVLHRRGGKVFGVEVVGGMWRLTTWHPQRCTPAVQGQHEARGE